MGVANPATISGHSTLRNLFMRLTPKYSEFELVWLHAAESKSLI
jgi:hypothetical protein